MKNIINGDFIYLNPDINQRRYRGLHGKRMEVLDLRHPWLEVENYILPLGEVVHEDDYLKAVVLKTFIQDPSLPVEQVVEVFDALATEEDSPHSIKFWVVYKDATRQVISLHLEDHLATLKSLVSEDGRLF